MFKSLLKYEVLIKLSVPSCMLICFVCGDTILKCKKFVCVGGS
jgi:hypothetical protein